MIMFVRKKFLSNVIWFLLINCFNFGASDSNDTVTINIKPTHISKIEPKFLKSDRNIDSNEQSNDLNKESNLNFPHNLAIVLQVLRKLENSACVRDTTTVLEAIANEQRWTLEMFDSFPKFPTGILYGNYYQLGNFDECIGVKQPIDQTNENDQILGQYCLADAHILSFNNNASKFQSQDRHKFKEKTLHWGICIPHTCTPKDAEIFVKEIFTSVVDNFGDISVVVDQNKCVYAQTEPVKLSEIIYGCLIGLFLIFSIFATVFHCWHLRRRKRCVAYNVDTIRDQTGNNILKEVILSFSFIRNISKFLHIKPSDLNLECIAGIKFLSMSFIIAGHSMIFLIGGPIENLNFIPKESVKISNGIFFNNVLLVDTFLLVSGFLMCRLLLIELDKRKGRLNILILYVARYIRLTPAYIVILGLYVSVLHRLGDGPLWNYRINLESERCLKSWWTNLLYINNYVNTDNLCMFQAWYLAVDYHLFIIAPFIIYPLWKWNKKGEILLFSLTAVAVVIPFWFTYINNWDPTLLVYGPEVSDLSTNYYFANVYIKTHMRSCSYFVGIAFGYLVHKLQTSGTKISSYIIWFGWSIAAVCGIVSMFSIVVFYSPHHEANSLESAIYSALHRAAWSLAIGWIMLVCITDNSAVINKFLSWKIFIPLSRLTYCAYLCNGLIEIYNISTLRQPTYLSIYELANKCLGHLILTFSAAFLLCVLFESPIHGLEKILLSREKSKEQRQNATLRPMEDS